MIDADRAVAEVAFKVGADVPLPTGVLATIQYRNLVGQRYIALIEGDGPSGGRWRRTRSSRSRRPSRRWT